MKNKDALKKHHFWILFGLVPLFVLIAVLVVSANVGDAITKREKDINDKKSAIKSKTNPKSNGLLAGMDGLITKVLSKKDGLWSDCYTPQKDIYSTDAMLKLVNEDVKEDFKKIAIPLETRKFGAPIDEKGQALNVNTINELLRRSEIYADWYDNLAKKIAPTSFDGGWQKQFRYIDSWTDVKLNSDQIWLIIEDMWIQKSLTEAIGSVNEQMAEFARIKFERNGQVVDDPSPDESKSKDPKPKNPLHRKFKNRNWEVELDVEEVGPTKERFLTGRLINTTNKLLPLGAGNGMILRVWLANGDSKTVPPFELRVVEEVDPEHPKDTQIIGGNFVAGAGESKGTPLKPSNAIKIAKTPIPNTMTVDEIVRVEQVFDSRTVPMHQVKNLALGFADARNAAFPLKPLKEDPAAAAAAADSSSSAGGGPGAGPGGGSMRMPGGPTGGFGGGQKSEAGPVYSGGGPVASVIDRNKKRYLEVNDQVRRMPVAVTVVVDQEYLEDVLIAFANSALRFQITQVTMNRFRGILDLGGAGSSGDSGGNNIVFGGNLSSASEFGTSKRPGGPGPGMGFSGSSGYGSRTGPGGMTGMGGMAPSTVTESQLTSGLIELTVYGIVSLYSSPEAAAADAKKDADTAKKEPTPKDKEQPKDKAPADKKTPDAKTSDKDKDPKKDKGPKDKAPAKDAAPKDATPKETPAPMETKK